MAGRLARASAREGESNLLRAATVRTGLKKDGRQREVNVQPTNVEIREESTVLALTWPDCGTRLLEAETLRRASRAASEIRRQVDGVELVIPPGFHVSAVELIGNYALRL